MGSDEPLAVGDEVRGWVDAARAMIDARAQVIAAADEAATQLQKRVVWAPQANRMSWHFLPLRSGDREPIRAVAAKATLPRIPADIQKELDRLVAEVGQATDDLQKVTGFGRLLLFGGTRDKANRAARLLPGYHKWFLASGLRDEIERAAPRDDPRVRTLGISDALADWVGLAQELPEQGKGAAIEAARSFVELPSAVILIQRAAADQAERRSAALNAGNAVRNSETDRMLAEMPVERLREASRDRIRVGVLTENDITTVHAVLCNEDRLEKLEGIGETSANRIRAAARTLRHNTFEEMPMRIDIKNRTAAHTEFLRRLRSWDAARRVSASPDDLARAEQLAPFAAAISATVTHTLVIPTSLSTVEDYRDAVRTVVTTASAISEAHGSAQSGDPWDDFLARPADYFALLAELGFITEDDEKTHGDLPAEIVEAVREFDLKADHLLASLRGYQSFAARFALVQRKVIIGDEMGLGKTVEAIAVLAHLRAKGEHHFLVICPAAVVTNWVREVSAKSNLAAHRLHGPDRNSASKQWVRKGGVAVTTFETLRWLIENVEQPALGCVVVDEAHCIKNPDALRTQRTAQILDSCERAILLTGTPLENRLDEFRNLVGYLRPDLALDADEFSPKKFRRQVAPAYLRRNQEDVLTELPELVEVDEWVTMSDEDVAAYSSAVNDRNFMAMRQAAMKQGIKSAKMQRLVELVEEAEANGRRVIVFSHFLDILRDVSRHMPGQVFGPLTGSVAASQRQVMVDEFSAANQGAVLVAQIVAGGVGLNIQAASVVVICEPQLKPTTEWQAIARAHRMGQLESVQVHRLLSDEGVDQRVREILARKKELFESFARESETAASAPEAYDVTEAELARDIIAAERQRLFGQAVPAASAQQQAKPADGVQDNSSPARGSAAPSAQRPAATGLTTHSPTAPSVTPKRRPEATVQPAGDQFTKPPRRVFAGGTALAPANAEARTPTAESTDLMPYSAFLQALSPISKTASGSIIDNVVSIVSVEGPVTGWRIHQVYRECASGRGPIDEFSRILNRAISAAEQTGRIVSENPLGRSGNKPITFRLPTQSSAIARELGPRTIDVVPPNEVVQYCRIASEGEASISGDVLIDRVGRMLRNPMPPADLRRAVLAARRIHTP
ncbi:SNF2-related protein [Rhodococcus sp. BE178]|uniref:DEAD/DEAH box helicase n=1 Tax=Rhodococcus sp. BE178 TaxID=2817737 RepID=UPI003D21684D